MTTQEEKENTINPQKKDLSLWAVYGICLFISAIFFFFFGFNSPLFTFNSHSDFNWFMTTGNGLANGKIPYRDLFEHKGPIVYFVFAFACLFPRPGFIILLIEIISMSLFFFFAYKISKKFLNTFYSLIVIPLLAFAVFTCWCRMVSASSIEEFALPIYTYFLLCWLEFLQEKKSWTWIQALCLGICFGIIFWAKFTLVYFLIAPIIIWLIISLYRQEWQTIINNLLYMLAGVLIITIPILLFFALNNAIDDLFYVYFYINITAYGTTDPSTTFDSLKFFFLIGPVILFLILYGVIRFTIDQWHNKTGWLLLIAFLVTFILIVCSCKRLVYYYGCLFPYAILGLIYILNWISKKYSTQKLKVLIFTSITILCLLTTIPLSTITSEWKQNKDELAPLAIAEVINNYETTNNRKATLFCYKIWDFGFYNSSKIIPNNYFFARNYFDGRRFSALDESIYNSIKNQVSEFVITEFKTWEKEKDNFLSLYYEPYKIDDKVNIYHHRIINRFSYDDYDFILLKKID